MGDTGSMLIGTVTSVLVIKFIAISQNPGLATPIQSAPALGFTVMMVPLLDTLRVFAIRISHKRSPFAADRNHIHHLLLDRGMNHRSVTLTLAALTIFVTAIVFSFRELGNTILLSGVILAFYSGIGFLYMTRKNAKVQPQVIELELEEEAELKPNIVTRAGKSMVGQEN